MRYSGRDGAFSSALKADWDVISGENAPLYS
jgi:hypothetical protein